VFSTHERTRPREIPMKSVFHTQVDRCNTVSPVDSHSSYHSSYNLRTPKSATRCMGEEMNSNPGAEIARYSRTARMLHWIVALLVFVTWPMGLMIDFVKDEVQLDFYLVHESVGFLVFWFILLRIGAKFYQTAPAIVGTTLERVAAHTVHGLIYIFLIIMPVSGFLATNAHGFPLQWFGVIPIWSPLGKSPQIAPIFSTIHEWSAWIVLGLFALHILAVVFHHLIRRDATLYRIL